MRYAIFLLAILFAVSPFLSDSFGGFDPADFPVPQRDPPVQPAGYAFAIWGLIYLWLIAHGARGLARAGDPGWVPTRAPLAVSLAIGAVWIPVANASPVWATLLILAMLAGALAALLRAGRGEPWLLAVPLGLYAGWLTAASAVSLGLLAAGWGLLSQTVAALLALALALLLGAAVLWRRPGMGYAAALAWALVAIVVRNLDGSAPVAGLAALGALGVAILAVARARRSAVTSNACASATASSGSGP